MLNQNVPNPFAERTPVESEVTVIFTRAQMLFHDGSGKLIELVDILQSGKGQINVFADDLSKGSYTYSLVVDGKVEQTKRMIKE